MKINYVTLRVLRALAMIVMIVTLNAALRAGVYYVDRYMKNAGWSTSEGWKLDRAIEAIRDLREGTWNPGYELNHIDSAIDSGYSLESMKTTKEELAGFRSGQSQRTIAIQRLADIRSGKDKSTRLFIEQLDKAGIRPEEIGSTRDEIKNFKKAEEKQYYNSALNSLRLLVKGNPEYYDDVEHRRVDFLVKTLLEAPSHEVDEFFEHQFTYEELGTSAEELLKLKEGAHKAVEKILAQRRAEYAR